MVVVALERLLGAPVAEAEAQLLGPSLLYLKSRQFVRTGSVAVVPAFCNLGGHPPTLLYPLLPPSGAHKVKSPSQPPILCIAVPTEKLANFEKQNHMLLHIHLLCFLMI